MKILMLTPYLPYPPASGGQIRTLNLLKYLSKTNDITLVALYKNEKEKKYASQLKSFCKKIYVCKRPEKPWQVGTILKSIFSALPFLVVRNYSYEAQDIVTKLLNEEEFDVIHAETFYIMPHIPQTTIPVLLVEQTIEFKVYQHYVSTLPFLLKWALTLDIIKLKFWEIYYWKKAQLVATVSASDKSIIQECVPDNETFVIPNGAGDEMFVERIPKKNISKPTLLFVGNFSWLQNTEAAMYLIEKVFPKLHTALPQIKLIIAGQNVKSKLVFPNTENVEVIDIAPDDHETIKNLYRDATIFVAPIFGPGGTRLKILAAMASGLPIVTTKTGIEGLEITENEDILVANTPSEFVKKIQSLLENEVQYSKMQKTSFAVVKEKYSWNAIAKKLEMVYKNSMHKTV
jgi:glycosyltransferase involved in cell wall biosynthesis